MVCIHGNPNECGKYEVGIWNIAAYKSRVSKGGLANNNNNMV